MDCRVLAWQSCNALHFFRTGGLGASELHLMDRLHDGGHDLVTRTLLDNERLDRAQRLHLIQLDRDDVCNPICSEETRKP